LRIGLRIHQVYENTLFLEKAPDAGGPAFDPMADGADLMEFSCADRNARDRLS